MNGVLFECIDKVARKLSSRGRVAEIASQHAFSESIFSDKHKIFGLADELKREKSFDGGAITFGETAPFKIPPGVATSICSAYQLVGSKKGVYPSSLTALHGGAMARRGIAKRK